MTRVATDKANAMRDASKCGRLYVLGSLLAA